LGFDDRLTTHGIRATISSALNELGYPRERIEVQSLIRIRIKYAPLIIILCMWCNNRRWCRRGLISWML